MILSFPLCLAFLLVRIGWKSRVFLPSSEGLFVSLACSNGARPSAETCLQVVGGLSFLR